MIASMAHHWLYLLSVSAMAGTQVFVWVKLLLPYEWGGFREEE
jgi:hypothetical protein